MSWNYNQPKKPRFNHTNDSGSIKPLRRASRGLSILEKVVVYTASLANRYSGKIMLTNTSLIFLILFQFFYFNF